MVGVPLIAHDGWTDAASRVERTAGVVNANKLGDEEGEADANWSDEGRSVLFLC